MSGMESFLGSRRSYLPRTGGASLRNTGRSFFANGGVSLPGANAFRGVDPRLLSAFMPSHTRWSAPRADARKAEGAMYPEVQALLKRKDTTAAPAVAPAAAAPAVAATTNIAAEAKDEETIYPADTKNEEMDNKSKIMYPKVQALLKKMTATPPAAAAAAAKEGTTKKRKEDDDDDEKEGGPKADSGILALPGTVSQPTNNAPTTAATAAVAPTTPASGRKSVAYAIPNTTGKASLNSPGVKSLKTDIAEGFASADRLHKQFDFTEGINRLRKQLTNVDVQIQTAKRSLLYFPPGPGQDVQSFASKRDVQRHMGLTSHKQVPKFISYGDVRSPSTGMKRKGFKGKLMAVMKADVERFGIEPAPMPQRQSTRPATQKEQRINPMSSKNKTK